MAVAGMNRFDVAVIGAGFAGLSAAVRLARLGARVLVLEARPRLGGRATAFPDRETGELVDNGQHVILGCYSATLAFLSEIGALDNVRLQKTLTVVMVDRAGVRSRLECPALPAPLHLVGGVLDWDALPWRDRLSVLRMATPLRLARRALKPGSQRIAASPGETVENWLVRNGQTARLCEMLWNPLVLAALNQPPELAAAPAFARVLGEMFGSDPATAAIGLPTKPLDQMYAEPARAFIEALGGEVRTGSPATVEIADGSEPSIAAVASGAERWSVTSVVSAVPWYALDGLFPGGAGQQALAPVLTAARAMAASPIVTVNLWFDRQIIDEPFVGLPGRTMQWVFDKRAVFGGSAAHVSLVSSGAAAILARRNDELTALAISELGSALPAVAGATVLRATVVREPRATFSLAPGQPSRPETRTAIRGLALAGDWIATGLPATIESAVRSGHRAAAAIAGGSDTA
jgi:squalene-associated FAD-dependent desaturase